MKHKVAIVLLAVLAAFFTSQAVYAEKQIVSLADFEDMEYSEGAITFNNFTIYEDEDDWFTPKGWHKLRVKLWGKNKSSDSLSLELQLAGLDQSGEVIWAMDAAPMMGILSENSLEEVSGSVLVQPGTLNSTDRIIVIFTGEL